jgi:hypothetical protein
MSSNLFEQINQALQGRMDAVIPELLPGGRQSGREYICASLQGGNGDSCSTNLDTGKGSDFATGEAWGDIIALAAKVWGCGQGEAAREIAERHGIMLGASTPPKPHTVSPAFTPITPVPANAPEPLCNHPQYGRASTLWRYTDAQGRLLCCTARFDLLDGSKAVLPLSYGQTGGVRHWQWKALPEPRPLYGLPKLAAMSDAPVLLVEGEKTADAAQALFQHHAVLTWSGGANTVAKADLSPLSGRKIVTAHRGLDTILFI